MNRQERRMRLLSVITVTIMKVSSYVTRLGAYITMSAILCISALASTGCGSTTAKQAPTPLVKTMVIGESQGADSTTYSGVIQNKTETQLAFQSSGQVVTKQIHVGDHVQAGQVLGSVDKSNVQDQVTRAHAAVTAAQSQYDLAATNANRYQSLYDQQAVSRLQLDQMIHANNSALAALEEAKANLNTATTQLAYTNLVAPDDGIITAVHFEVGQVVAAGQQVATMTSGNEPEAVIALPEQIVGTIHSGMPVTVSLWALPNQSIQGVVREISPVPDPVSRTYTVRISLSNPPAALELGMTANVSLTSAANEAITIPITALTKNSTGQASVYVIRKNTLHLVPVTTSQFQDNNVLVTQGLSRGDRIVTAGVDRLSDGETVRF